MQIENQLSTIKKQLQSYLNNTFKYLNIKSSEIIFLKVLKDIGKTSQIDISRKLDCDKSHIHRITNKLLDKNLIEFLDNETNKTRNLNFQITKQGKILINKVDEAMDDWTKKLINGISKKDLDVFKSVMQKITQNATQIKMENYNDKNI